MLRDPNVFKQPEQFNPDRFMGDHPETDPRAIVFGFGRRACPGRFLAEASLRITAAMLAYSFEFKPAEVNGKPVHLECEPLKGGVVK
jgi:cytochrome P450